MPKPVIITCAPMGGIHTPRMSPHLPVTPAEIGRLRYGFTWVNTHGIACPEVRWAAMRGSETGCGMSIYSLDACIAARHGMVAHG